VALFTQQNLEDWLHLPTHVAAEVSTDLNERKAEREARSLVTSDTYDRIESNQSAGESEYDRLAQAEALFAVATYIGNRGGLRLSEKGGLVRDLGLINQQQTIRQLLRQGQVEQVQGRLRQQAEGLVGDLAGAASHVWAV
jgi:hypothetical protein